MHRDGRRNHISDDTLDEMLRVDLKLSAAEIGVSEELIQRTLAAAKEGRKPRTPERGEEQEGYEERLYQAARIRRVRQTAGAAAAVLVILAGGAAYAGLLAGSGSADSSMSEIMDAAAGDTVAMSGELQAEAEGAVTEEEIAKEQDTGGDPETGKLSQDAPEDAESPTGAAADGLDGDAGNGQNSILTESPYEESVEIGDTSKASALSVLADALLQAESVTVAGTDGGEEAALTKEQSERLAGVLDTVQSEPADSFGETVSYVVTVVLEEGGGVWRLGTKEEAAVTDLRGEEAYYRIGNMTELQELLESFLQ